VQQALAKDADVAREEAVEAPDGFDPRLQVVRSNAPPPYILAIVY
jgi:hypothetical protein